MPLVLAFPAMLLLGLGIGALFPLSLIVTLDHADEPASAGRLTAFVQGGGYIIASIMPFAAGWLRNHSDDLTQAWVAMAVGIVLLLLLALRFSPGKRVI
ncbi:cyanate transporter [compost metagenome]